MNFDYALSLHGKPKGERFEDPNFNPARANWLGWLCDTLSDQGIASAAPCMQMAWKGDMAQWVRSLELQLYFRRTDSGLVLPMKDWISESPSMDSRIVYIGHSMAAQAYFARLTRLLEFGQRLDSYSDILPKALVLVAPYIDLKEKYTQGEEWRRIDPRLSDVIERIILVHSREDQGGVPESIDYIMGALPSAELVELDGYGHFMTGNAMDPDYDLGHDLRGSSFPELIRILETV